MYYPAATDYPTPAIQPDSHFSRRDHTGNTRSMHQPPGVAGSRGRSIRRDFVFGTPPDYVPTSPPEEFMRRGRDRRRTSSTESVRGRSSRHTEPMSPGLAEPRISNYYNRSRTLSQPRSDHHHHHRHKYRDSTSSRAVSPTRPSHSRRRSRSLPPAHHAYYQGHNYYPSTANSRAPFQLATSAAPMMESRNRPSEAGCFSWLFGPKVKNTHRHTRASQSVSTRYMQPVGYGNGYGNPPQVASGAHGTQGTTSNTRYQVPQGYAVAHMYTPPPSTIVSFPQSIHTPRRKNH